MIRTVVSNIPHCNKKQPPRTGPLASTNGQNRTNEVLLLLFENPLHFLPKQINPLGMIGEPVDIAALALVAASPTGRFLTATTLVVDGGEMSAGPFG